MMRQRLISLGVLLAAMVPAAAMAKTEIPARTKAAVHLVQPLQLADVVVQSPPSSPTPAPAPVAAPVVAPAPVAVEAPRSNTTYVEHENHRSYMSTVAINALMGGLAGVLVGGSIYYLADNQHHAGRVLYWGAGGVLLGVTVGVIQVATEESRADRAVGTNLPTDPAPTVRLALWTQSF
ncbi:MAG TPA: hypothetical protein VH374_01920 [Polyangia bacterium]|jgi:hypothetical protein|nr:hypothetical protein [Polyangia bacterium]